ncbi:MAG: HAMP domain-containing histidine kinase [Gemmatimonadetes bacterium]|nr:HAMP domain-containing histidine kinase [Gemmatimonadota bacterium]
MRFFRRLSLRTQFLLVLLLGAILPLTLVALWLTRSAERSGEALVRERLDRDLRQVIEEIGLRWVRYRSDLLTLAEHPALQQALQGGAGTPGRPTSVLPQDLHSGISEIAEEVVLRDGSGGERWRLSAPLESAGAAQRVVSSVVPVTLDLFDRRTGIRIGALDARIRVSALLPSGAGWVGVGGSVLGIFDPGSGAPLLPLTIDPARFRQARFIWADEPWVTATQALSEPPIEIVLAAPLGPITGPFTLAARRGTVALLGVVLATFLLVTLVTGGLTGSLKRLATAADAVAGGNLALRLAQGSNDEIARVAGAFNAMTESLKRTLNELSHRQSLAAVGEFAASLAHEIRNPLTAIRLDLQRVAERISDPAARELIQRTLHSVERLDATVTGALRIARSGKVARSVLDLRQPIRSAMEGARPEFAARGAILEPLADGPGSVPVMGDAAALEQLFLNLLLNAAQAAGTGGRAAVSVEREDASITVRVRDFGPGIAAEQLEHVFEPFYSTRPEGTGLGLAIAQRIAAAHGGDLRLESTPGEGTTARLRLPALQQAAPG